MSACALTSADDLTASAPPVRPAIAPLDVFPLEDVEGEEFILPEPEEEAADAPLLRDPGEPTQAEVDQHNLTHAAFRSWCPHCVRGRARNNPHRAVQRESDAAPTLSFDYGFLSGGVQDESSQTAAGFSPVLVMHDEVTSSVFSHAVPHKGVDYPEVTLVLRAVCRDIYSLGYKRVIFKDDQEPALVAFLQALRRALMGEVVFERSPVGDAQSHGAVERAVQTMQGFARTIRDAVEYRLQVKVNPENPLMSWLVNHAVGIHRRYSIGADGRTAYQRCKGKLATTAVVEFGEKVWCRPTSHLLRTTVAHSSSPLRTRLLCWLRGHQ